MAGVDSNQGGAVWMRFLVLIAFVLLVGCASSPAQEAKLAKFKSTVPECNNEEACELMWSASRRWVLDTAKMKIQTHTDSFIETYNSVGSSVNLAARVTKEPQGGGVYKFHVETWCSNLFTCSPDRLESMIAFNAKVGGAGHRANAAAKKSAPKKEEKAVEQGKYQYTAQKLASSHGCEGVMLLSQHPPVEVFEASCSGEAYLLRCEWNQCAVVR